MTNPEETTKLNEQKPTFGRYAEIPVEKMTPAQKKGYDFVVKERGHAPGPYKIWLQNPKLMEVMVPLGAYYQGHSSLSKAEIEIATNLTNGRWLAAYSNYKHEIMVRGRSVLIAPRVVPTGLYRRAVSLLGDVGLTDLTVLIGYFTCVSLSLIAYVVPASAIGLQR